MEKLTSSQQADIGAYAEQYIDALASAVAAARLLMDDGQSVEACRVMLHTATEMVANVVITGRRGER